MKMQGSHLRSGPGVTAHTVLVDLHAGAARLAHGPHMHRPARLHVLLRLGALGLGVLCA